MDHNIKRWTPTLQKMDQAEHKVFCMLYLTPDSMGFECAKELDAPTLLKYIREMEIELEDFIRTQEGTKQITG